MAAIRGTYRNGQVILSDPPPADWPDGAEVRLKLVDDTDDEGDDPLGILGTDPASVARWEAYMATLEPMRMSEEESAELERALRAQREAELAIRKERDEKLRGLFP